MKKYNVTVNGKVYGVEVEEVEEIYSQAAQKTQAPIDRTATPDKAVSVPAPVAPAAPVVATPVAPAAPVVQATPAPAPAPTPAPAASNAKPGKISIKAPMPGTILKVLVKVGDSVEKNQPVMVLEAMKMENEIVALEKGKVATIDITEGSTVKTNDVLLTID